MMPLVFVVDGVAERRGDVQCALEQAGCRVEIFATTHALEAAELEPPDAMAIAGCLPDGSGVQLCQTIRKVPGLSRTRLILLAGDESPAEQILKVSCADVVLSAPSMPDEVVAAVETVLRGASSPSNTRGDIVINSSAMRVAVRGKQIPTTTLEFRLIDYMARHKGKVFSRDALLDAVWGDLQFVTPRSVDACVRRIRRKIEPRSSSPTFLKSVRGVGYTLDATPVWENSPEFCRCPTCSATRMRTKSFARNQIIRNLGTQLGT